MLYLQYRSKATLQELTSYGHTMSPFEAVPSQLLCNINLVLMYNYLGHSLLVHHAVDKNLP